MREPGAHGCCLINHPNQVPERQSGKDSQPRREMDEEQPTSADRSHGPRLLFLILISSQIMVEVTVTEASSTRQEKRKQEAHHRQLSTTTDEWGVSHPTRCFGQKEEQMAVDMRVVDEDAAGATLDSLLESPNGTHPGYAQKEDHRVMDR